MKTLAEIAYDFVLKGSLAYFKSAGYFGTQTQVATENSAVFPGQFTRILLETRGFIANRRFYD